MIPTRFWAKVHPQLHTGCWLWAGSTRSGYAAYWDGARVVRGHRYLYELLLGPVPEGLVLDHLCGVPSCVNPGHLEPVSQKTNLNRSEKYRQTRPVKAREVVPA